MKHDQSTHQSTGLDKLLSLGYSKARLSRLMGVHPSTISQWIKYGRVGIDSVGRVAVVPELRSRITVRDVRPDLEAPTIEALIAAARVWRRHRAHV